MGMGRIINVNKALHQASVPLQGESGRAGQAGVGSGGWVVGGLGVGNGCKVWGKGVG